MSCWLSFSVWGNNSGLFFFLSKLSKQALAKTLSNMKQQLTHSGMLTFFQRATSLRKQRMNSVMIHYSTATCKATWSSLSSPTNLSFQNTLKQIQQKPFNVHTFMQLEIKLKKQLRSKQIFAGRLAEMCVLPLQVLKGTFVGNILGKC